METYVPRWKEWLQNGWWVTTLPCPHEIIFKDGIHRNVTPGSSVNQHMLAFKSAHYFQVICLVMICKGEKTMVRKKSLQSNTYNVPSAEPHNSGRKIRHERYKEECNRYSVHWQMMCVGQRHAGGGKDAQQVIKSDKVHRGCNSRTHS